MTKFLDTQGLKYFYNQIKSKFAAASHSHNNMKGATSSAAGAAGLAPAPAAGAATRYLRSDGTWQIPPNTTYSAATQSANGLMTAADKKKLDGIATGANAYTHPSSGVTAGTYRSVTVNAQGHVTGGSNPTITIAQGGTGATTVANAVKALLGTTAIGSSTKPMYYDGAALKACADSIGGGGIVAANLAQNGYVKFANGLILQWGAVNGGANTTRSFTFPIAFASVSAAFTTHRTNNLNWSGSNNHDVVSALTNTQCNVGTDNSVTVAYIFAIGK